MTTIGSLCSGYGGLDMGLIDALGEGEILWHAETDPAANRVLAHHWPGTPNLGDITAVDWATIPRPDWITAGYPCQPFSDAGLRKGNDDDRHLWPYVANAIRVLRPRYALLENVRGHLKRGFPDVLADLATLGYVGSWACVRASDIGACHRRERLFVLAARHGEPRPTLPGRLHRTVDADTPPGPPATTGHPVLNLLPTPRAVDSTGPSLHGDGGLDLSTAVLLLPTPRATDGPKGSPNQHGRRGDVMLTSAVQPGRRGLFDAAIWRWERLRGPAPFPTEQYPGGSPMLTARFVEWMMGLEPGHVTAAPRISRNEALRLLGNGVVPQQAAYAVRLLAERLSCIPAK